MKQYCLFSFLILIPLSTFAEELFPVEGSTLPLIPSHQGRGNNLKLSLQQAIEIALKNGRDIGMAREALHSSKARFDLSMSEFTPKTEVIFSANRGYQQKSDSIEEKRQTFSSSSSDTYKAKYQWRMDKLPSEILGGRVSTIFDIGIERQDTHALSQDKEKYLFAPSITLSYKQPLTKDGRVASYSPISNANYEWESANINYNNTEQVIVLEVITGYYNLVKALEYVTFLEENLKQTEKQLELARIQLRLGAIAEIQALKLEVQLLQERSNLIDAYKRLKGVNEQFAILLGDSMIGRIIPTTIPEYSPKNIDREKSIETALKERKELQELEYSQRLLEVSLSGARSTNDSYISFAGNYQRKGEGREIGALFDNLEQEEWSIGASINIPIDDHGITRNKTEQILSSLSSLRINREKMRDRITFEVNEAVRNLESTKRRYEILEKGIKIAEENLKIDELRFSRGVISSDELQRTQLALLQLKVDRFNTLIDYQLAEVALKRAMGVLEASRQ